MTATRIPVLLDTDIGTDIDDLLALLAIFGSPELELVGITTTYGDTVLRARIIKQICDWAGVDVLIGAGEGETLSGREVWHAGYEGLLLDSNAAAARFEPEFAADVIAGAVHAHMCELRVIAIGPLTNIAVALDQSHIGSGVRQISVMGGNFAVSSRAEHNFLSDAVAAHRVMESGAAISVIGVDQTRRIRLYREQLMDAVVGSGPLRTFVQRESQRWMDVNSLPYVLLHDPMAVAMLTDPVAFAFSRGIVDVGDAGAVEGFSSFTPYAQGSTEVVRSLDEDVLRSLLVKRLIDGLHE